MKLKIHVLLGAFLFGTAFSTQAASLPIERIPNQKPRNIIFVLTDDHRYDAMGFVGHPWLETPVMDKMAAQGAHFPNAFVTTSLCAPSRASIITGLYAHNHQVIDNYNPVRPDLTYFPQYLQSAHGRPTCRSIPWNRESCLGHGRCSRCLQGAHSCHGES